MEIPRNYISQSAAYTYYDMWPGCPEKQQRLSHHLEEENMVYIANGQVLDGQRRSPWRLSIITDLFWGFTDFVVMFFQSMIQPDVSRRGNANSLSSSRFSDRRGPPGNPPRRMGRINHGSGPSPPPMAGGG